MEKVEVVKKDNRVYVVTPEGEIPRKQWVIDRFNEDNKRSVSTPQRFDWNPGCQCSNHELLNQVLFGTKFG